VYGPSTDVDKPDFLGELHYLRSLRSDPWLLADDFNMIYRAGDKNNSNLNRRRMSQFRRFINAASLKELHLNGRLFMWSNEWAHPALERINCAFVSKEWDELYLNNDLHSLASVCSDHAPLLLWADNVFAYKKSFHAFWPRFPRYLEIVERAWHCPMNGANPFCCLDWLLRNTAVLEELE
jgi:hypothetical protein